jgi:hypothetical protein
MDAELPGCADLFLPDEWGMGLLEQGTLPFTSGVLDLAPALSWDSDISPTPAAFAADASESTWPQPSLWLPAEQAQQPADSTTTTTKAPRRSTSKKAAAKPTTAAPGIAGGSSVSASRRGPTRQELRQQQQRQRAVEQQRIKELEQQLVSLRQQMQVRGWAHLCGWRRRVCTTCIVCCSQPPCLLTCMTCCLTHAPPFPLLQSISIENKHLQQRQEALNATLDMQQQIRAAAAAAAAAAEAEAANNARTISDSASLRSEDGEEAFSFGFDSGDEATERAGGIADSLLLGVTTGESSGAGEPEAAAAASGAADWQPHAAGAVATAAAMEDGPHVRPSGSGWFFAATLVQHIRWYQRQVGGQLPRLPGFRCAGWCAGRAGRRRLAVGITCQWGRSHLPACWVSSAPQAFSKPSQS